MLIAVTADSLGVSGIVPSCYEDSAMLIIVETDNDRAVAQYPRTDSLGIEFCERMNAHRCEAVVCGVMGQPGFEAAAATGITRYYGAGLTVLKAAHRAVENTLPLLTDYEGGTGCGAHNPVGCPSHDHDEQERG